METDDRQLVLQCRQGREDAYRELLSRYEGYIYSLCYRLCGHREDALELAQESMLRIVTGLDSYQVNRPFKPWLRQVVVNVCLNFLRKRAPDMLSLEEPFQDNLSLADMLASGDDPQKSVEWTETQDSLKQAMGRLPPQLRLVLTLRHQEEMSYQEIAETTGMPVGTVKTHLFRARSLLRTALSDVYGWEV
ncbi:MAG: RNA polymerase sigma factor [Candidatus Saccharibacteria bacterium]